MTTISQDKSFAIYVLGSALEDAIEWISKNLNPGEVFDKDDLESWAKENGFVEGE